MSLFSTVRRDDNASERVTIEAADQYRERVIAGLAWERENLPRFGTIQILPDRMTYRRVTLKSRLGMAERPRNTMGWA